MNSREIDEITVRLIAEKVANNLPDTDVSELCSIIGLVIRKVLEEHEMEEHKNEIVEVGKSFYEMGFLSGTSGNISVRAGENALLITPSGINKGSMKPDDILLTDMEGRKLDSRSRGKPSSETKMHVIAYKKRPDVGAIIHTHPPFCTGFAAAGLPLDMPVLPEAILVLGDIPLVEYGTPSTHEIPDKLESHLPGHNAFLLAKHGAMTFGRNLKEASQRMETLELFAKVILIARMLGGEKLLDKKDLEKLERTFKSE